MFKRFLKKIISSANREDAVKNVLHGNEYHYGIEEAHESHLINDEEYSMLVSIIEKMA